MLNVSVQPTDKATPFLKRLTSQLTDRTDLNRMISGRAEELTRKHIRRKARVTHKTARRLGAKPTGYLEDKARAVESTWSKEAATVHVEGAIFARVSGPVKVTARKSKFLTIPAHKAAYGKRARELGGLDLIRFGSGGPLALVSPQADGGVVVMYWLRKSVTLPQDRTLLPKDKQYEQAAELGARDFIELIEDV